MVRLEGLEPPANEVEARCSNPLSYNRIVYLYEIPCYIHLTNTGYLAESQGVEPCHLFITSVHLSRVVPYRPAHSPYFQTGGRMAESNSWPVGSSAFQVRGNIPDCITFHKRSAANTGLLGMCRIIQ